MCIFVILYIFYIFIPPWNKLEHYPSYYESKMSCESHFMLPLINTTVSVIFTLLVVWNVLYLFSTGEKPFECKLCHQRSRDYSAMIKHLRTHNGASPYQCTICQEYCPSLSSMQKHMKAHKPEDVPPDWRIEKTYLYLCYVWDRATKKRNGKVARYTQGQFTWRFAFGPGQRRWGGVVKVM